MHGTQEAPVATNDGSGKRTKEKTGNAPVNQGGVV